MSGDSHPNKGDFGFGAPGKVPLFPAKTRAVLDLEVPLFFGGNWSWREGSFVSSTVAGETKRWLFWAKRSHGYMFPADVVRLTTKC